MASHKLNTFQNIYHIVTYVNSCLHLMYTMYVKMQNKNVHMQVNMHEKCIWVYIVAWQHNYVHVLW